MADEPLDFNPSLLLKLDGLEYINKMPPCYTSQPSPKCWNQKGTRPPRPISFGSGGVEYKVARAAEYRDKCPKNPLAFARMRHIKCVKAGVYSGDETPADAYVAEDIQKISLLKLYKDEDEMSFSGDEET